LIFRKAQRRCHVGLHQGNDRYPKLPRAGVQPLDLLRRVAVSLRKRGSTIQGNASSHSTRMQLNRAAAKRSSSVSSGCGVGGSPLRSRCTPRVEMGMARISLPARDGAASMPIA
jgi:hypothetical protein